MEKWYYTYDFENRLTKVEYFDGTQTTVLGEYYYDGDGKRIKKVESSQTTIYIYLDWNIIFEKESSTMMETKHIFGPNGHVAEIKGGTRYYCHSDHLGSLSAITDSTGNLLLTMTYDSFGEVRSGSSNRIRYTLTGKEQDATELYYYGARYYDPKVGRFITADQLAGKINNSQSLDKHIYTANNPLKFIDPTGNQTTTNYQNKTETKTTTKRSGQRVVEKTITYSDGSVQTINGAKLDALLDFLDEYGDTLYALGSAVAGAPNGSDQFNAALGNFKSYVESISGNFQEGMGGFPAVEIAVGIVGGFEYGYCWVYYPGVGWSTYSYSSGDQGTSGFFAGGGASFQVGAFSFRPTEQNPTYTAETFAGTFRQITDFASFAEVNVSISYFVSPDGSISGIAYSEWGLGIGGGFYYSPLNYKLIYNGFWIPTWPPGG